MNLTRSRKVLVVALLLGVGGGVVLVTAGDRISILRWLLGGAAILAGLALLYRELQTAQN